MRAPAVPGAKEFAVYKRVLVATDGSALSEKAVAAALGKGVRSAQAIVMKSNQVAEAIVATAKNQQCDLIVMASHGRRSLARLLMGSETLHVPTHSHIPVLVLRQEYRSQFSWRTKLNEAIGHLDHIVPSSPPSIENVFGNGIPRSHLARHQE